MSANRYVLFVSTLYKTTKKLKFYIVKSSENNKYVKIYVSNTFYGNKFAVFLQLFLLRLFQTGSGRYKRYMVLLVLRECKNNTENVAVFGFELILCDNMDIFN